MARPSKIPEGFSLYRDTNGTKENWRVRLGKKYRVKGEKPKKYTFKTEALARQFIKDEYEKREGFPAESKRLGLTQDQVRDAQLALHKLGDKGTLLVAVEEWLRVLHPFKEAPTVKIAIEELMENRRVAQRKERHMKTLKTKVPDVFSEVLEKKINEVTLKDMQKSFSRKYEDGTPPSPQQIRKRILYANILFNFAITRDWIGENRSPIKSVSPPTVTPKKTQKFSVDEITKLLWTVHESMPSMIAPLAIKIFGGVRNEELYKLEWENIVDDSIMLGPEITKTSQQRSVTITPVLKQWLELAVETYATIKREQQAIKAGKPIPKGKIKTKPAMSGLIFSNRSKIIDREAIWLDLVWWLKQKSGVTNWPQNILRTTFGSYHYKKVKNPSITAYEMGNSPAVVNRHYVNLVSDADCEAFWNLTPARVETIMGSLPVKQTVSAQLPEYPEREEWVRTEEDLEPDETPVFQPTPTDSSPE